MSFSLKNARATYQRMATVLLHDMMHNEVEVYVNDMIVKSKDGESHTMNLRKFLERIKEYKLRLNPQKCTFEVTAKKLLGFLVSDKGIEVDLSKIKTILEMPPPRSEKEIRGFLGRLQYISRFIAKLTSTSELYSMTSLWPLLVWGINVIGRIAPKALNRHEYILMALGYFTKWMEAASYSLLKAKHVARFLENNIICWFGVPQEIISNNGSHF